MGERNNRRESFSRDNGRGRSRDESRDNSSRDRYRSRDNDSRGRDNYSRNDRFSRPNRDREMHTVVCDECGISCTVPFKPSSDKPVLCENCFKGKKQSSRNNDSNLAKELLVIQEKLDKIMTALNIE